MLDHRQRRHFALPQAVCEQSRQLLGGRRDQRKLGNKVRCFCQQQPPDLGKLGQLMVGDKPPFPFAFFRGAEASSSRSRKPNSGAASAQGAPFSISSSIVNGSTVSIDDSTDRSATAAISASSSSARSPLCGCSSAWIARYATEILADPLEDRRRRRLGKRRRHQIDPQHAIVDGAAPGQFDPAEPAIGHLGYDRTVAVEQRDVGRGGTGAEPGYPQSRRSRHAAERRNGTNPPEPPRQKTDALKLRAGPRPAAPEEPGARRRAALDESDIGRANPTIADGSR